MAALPLHQRKFHAFLSHAHADKGLVDSLYTWLMGVAGIPVWYDARNLPAGATIATHLAEAIPQCRTLLLVLSSASVKSGWVKEEYEAAVGQRTQWKNFRILPVRIDNCEIPGFLQTTKWVDLPQATAPMKIYGHLLADLYYDDIDLDFETTRDVYVSRSWRESEKQLPDYVCQLLMQMGFRLIGDSQDHLEFKEERITSILSSCGGLISILPDRGQGTTSKPMLREIELARTLRLPHVIIAEPTVKLEESLAPTAIQVAVVDIERDQSVEAFVRAAIEDRLVDEWRQPERPHIFFGTGFDNTERNQEIKQILQRVTALPCITGDQIREGQIQQVITRNISQAVMVITDISEENLNTCVEAGIARGAAVPFHLVAKEPRHRPPFMFRDQQVWYYKDDIDLMGIAHRIAYPYRRRVLNWELRK